MTKVGRPRKFESVEAMSTAIEAYFDKCDKREKAVVNKDGSVAYVSHPMPYTMSGLAETIGISRRRLLDYNDREDEYGEEFRPTTTRARARVERNLEERLYDGVGSPAGIIFGLKNNYSWTDKQQIEHSGKGGGPIEDKDLEAMPTKELLELLRISRGNSDNSTDEPTG